MGITVENFGSMPDGRKISLYRFTTSWGGEFTITDLGGKMVSLLLPDREGQRADVIMGFDRVDSYLVRNPYFGSLVGRYANRIGNASYQWEGKTYHLDANEGPHHLHGGAGGFDKQLWSARIEDQDALKLSLFSRDQDQGYPGNLQVEVVYRFTQERELVLEYKAWGDQDTPVNLTNHCYFNLAGHDSGDIRDHILWLDSDRVTAVDGSCIPTGDIWKVEGTPLDFRKPARIGDGLESGYACIEREEGYNFNYILDHRQGKGLDRFCMVWEPSSGRTMEGFTTMPGVQFYTANTIKDDFTFVGKGGVRYLQHCGFCLETQYYPDSPNQPDFPSAMLRKGQVYQEKTMFRFGVEGS